MSRVSGPGPFQRLDKSLTQGKTLPGTLNWEGIARSNGV